MYLTVHRSLGEGDPGNPVGERLRVELCSHDT